MCQSLPLWLALHNPNIRILLHSAVLEKQSEKYIRAIREHIEKGKLLRGLYGELGSTKTGKWTDSELCLRREASGQKEATFTAGAIGSVQTGHHYDMIISDDPHNEENITTREQLEKVHEDHRALLPVLEPHGVFVLIGTRWHYDDLFNRILDNPEGWDVGENYNCREPQFNRIYPPGFLAEQRAALGGYDFSRWYLNDPIDAEKAEFKRDWFKYWDGELEAFGSDYTIYAAIDPALGEKIDADYIGIAVVAKPQVGPVYVLEARRARMQPPELVKEVFRIHERYKDVGLYGIGIEANAFQVLFKYWAQEVAERRGIYPRVIKLNPQQRESRGDGPKKLRAIRALSPRYEAGMIKHRPTFYDLEDELLRFPVGKRRDIADALAYAAEMGARDSGESTVAPIGAAVEVEELPGDFPAKTEDWYNN